MAIKSSNTSAIANATGCWFHSLPVTSEKIAMAVLEGKTGVIGD